MLTLAPLSGSPAIDAGFNSGAVDSSFVALESDARGAPRILRALSDADEVTVDIGALEVIPEVAFDIEVTSGSELVLTASGLPGTSYLLQESPTLDFEEDVTSEEFSLDENGDFTLLDSVELDSNFYRLQIIGSEG